MSGCTCSLQLKAAPFFTVYVFFGALESFRHGIKETIPTVTCIVIICAVEFASIMKHLPCFFSMNLPWLYIADARLKFKRSSAHFAHGFRMSSNNTFTFPPWIFLPALKLDQYCKFQPAASLSLTTSTSCINHSMAILIASGSLEMSPGI